MPGVNNYLHRCSNGHEEVTWRGASCVCWFCGHNTSSRVSSDYTYTPSQATTLYRVAQQRRSAS